MEPNSTLNILKSQIKQTGTYLNPYYIMTKTYNIKYIGVLRNVKLYIKTPITGYIMCYTKVNIS